MSFWSTLASIFHIRKQQRTLPIMLEIYRPGGLRNLSVTCPRELADNIRLLVNQQQPDGTWKRLELPSDTGTENMGHWLFFHPSSCHQSQKRETDGSYEKRLRAYYEARGIPRIFADLSLSAYTQDRDLEQS